jgi:hypothetical protein
LELDGDRAARKFVAWTSSGRKKNYLEWCETLPVLHPGQRPEDVLDGRNFLTVANMDGRSHTYHWPPAEADAALLAPRDKDHGPRTLIPKANIQVVNTRSEF